MEAVLSTASKPIGKPEGSDPADEVSLPADVKSASLPIGLLADGARLALRIRRAQPSSPGQLPRICITSNSTLPPPTSIAFTLMRMNSKASPLS
jgi:hypothetical protein